MSRYGLVLIVFLLACSTRTRTGEGDYVTPKEIARQLEEEGYRSPGGHFGNRSGTKKNAALRAGGGDEETEGALALALQWLATHQYRRGNWLGARYEGGHDTDDTVTGLALLAFLGAGHSADSEQYGKNVRQAIEWILKRQDDEVRGHFGKFSYQAAFTLMAMCEAYAMCGDEALVEPVQRAVDAACKAQNPDGGWRYVPNSRRSRRRGTATSDTSVAGWWLMALKSAKSAGFTVPKETWENADRWFESIAKGEGYDWSGGYTCPAKQLVPTAVLMCCRQFLGHPRDDPIILGCADNLINERHFSFSLPARRLEFDQGCSFFYLWYYEALGFFQLGVGSEYWQTFNPLMKKQLLSTQCRDGTVRRFKGSWDPYPNRRQSGRGNHWGRVGQTAIGALMLEVYYRYEPVHEYDDYYADDAE